jgi:hypothetical protein
MRGRQGALFANDFSSSRLCGQDNSPQDGGPMMGAAA